MATAAPLGVLVTGADLPNAFPYVIAVERLVSAGVPTATALPVLAGYAVVYCLPCLLLLGAGAAWGARVRARLERVHRRFGGERDVPRSVGAALGLAALAAAAAGSPSRREQQPNGPMSRPTARLCGYRLPGDAGGGPWNHTTCTAGSCGTAGC